MPAPDSAIERLVKLSQAVLDCEGSEACIDAIDLYCKEFEQWYSTGGSLDEAALRLLSDQHQKVLARAEAARDEAQHGMRQVHQRARGILAYIDDLPKRVSYRKGKKG